MTNRTIKIGLSSVLIFLSFRKIYDILTTFLLWLHVELRIENEAILITLNVLLGIVALSFLIIAANRLLRTENLENKVIFFLVGLTLLLTVIMGLTNKFYGEYLAEIDLKEFDMTYVFQYSWTKSFDMIFPIFGLLYYLWKMKRNTVANKTYKQ